MRNKTTSSSAHRVLPVPVPVPLSISSVSAFLNRVPLSCSPPLKHRAARLLSASLKCLTGSIRACKNAALKCDELKFEHYKLVVGALLTADVTQRMENCLEKIKILEH